MGMGFADGNLKNPGTLLLIFAMHGWACNAVAKCSHCGGEAPEEGSAPAERPFPDSWGVLPGLADWRRWMSDIVFGRDINPAQIPGVALTEDELSSAGSYACIQGQASGPHLAALGVGSLARVFGFSLQKTMAGFSDADESHSASECETDDDCDYDGADGESKTANAIHAAQHVPTSQIEQHDGPASSKGKKKAKLNETGSSEGSAYEHMCDNPGCTNEGCKKCSVCRAAFYCSASCQKADWKLHKKACKSMKPKSTK
eukprot:scaffold15328_cov16-Prasinocladus_malaysianus.AAC.3